MKYSHDIRHRSGEILLQILGGLLIASLVSNWNLIEEFLSKGCDLTPQNQSIRWAYFAFVLNVVRQMHGLSVAMTKLEKTPDDIILNIIQIFALFLVVMIPSYFIVWISNNISMIESGDGYYIYAVYLTAALAYVIWDIVTFIRENKNKTSATNNPESLAEVITTHIIFKFIAGIVIICFFGVSVGLGSRIYKIKEEIKAVKVASAEILPIKIIPDEGKAVKPKSEEAKTLKVGTMEDDAEPDRLWTLAKILCAILVCLIIWLLSGLVFLQGGKDFLKDLAGFKDESNDNRSFPDKVAEESVKSLTNILIKNRINPPGDKDFALNWQIILLFSLFIGIYYMDGIKSIPIVITAMCLFYTFFDYILNRNYYFKSS